MHINYLDDDNLVIFLTKEKLGNINFEIYDEIEQYFRKLFINLKQNYSIKLNGYYNIKIYKDKLYGIVLEIKGEDIDYLDLFDNQVEMNIEIKEGSILYQIDDYFFLNNKNDMEIYKYQNKLYILLKNKISNEEYLKLIEFSNLVYDESVQKVLNNGIKIRI